MVWVCGELWLDPLYLKFSSVLRVINSLIAETLAIMLLPAVLGQLIVIGASVADLPHALAFKGRFVPHQSD